MRRRQARGRSISRPKVSSLADGQRAANRSSGGRQLGAGRARASSSRAQLRRRARKEVRRITKPKEAAAAAPTRDVPISGHSHAHCELADVAPPSSVLRPASRNLTSGRPKLFAPFARTLDGQELSRAARRMPDRPLATVRRPRLRSGARRTHYVLIFHTVGITRRNFAAAARIGSARRKSIVRAAQKLLDERRGLIRARQPPRSRRPSARRSQRRVINFAQTKSGKKKEKENNNRLVLINSLARVGGCIVVAAASSAATLDVCCCWSRRNFFSKARSLPRRRRRRRHNCASEASINHCAIEMSRRWEVGRRSVGC